jgi:hypothetical protein
MVPTVLRDWMAETVIRDPRDHLGLKALVVVAHLILAVVLDSTVTKNNEGIKI